MTQVYSASLVAAMLFILVVAAAVVVALRGRMERAGVTGGRLDARPLTEDTLLGRLQEAYTAAKTSGRNPNIALVPVLQPMSIVERARLRRRITDHEMLKAFDAADELVNPTRLESVRRS